MANFNDLINLSDKLDKLSLEKEADLLDNFIKSAAKPKLHKCGLKEESVEHHLELFENYKKAMDHFEKEYKKAMRSRNEVDSPNMGKLREITASYAHNCNSVRFHNIYIDDVINSKPYPLEKDNQMKELFKDLYEGGSSKFTDELSRLAKVSRNGWVVLNFCTMTRQLYLDVIDLHDQHVIACSVPVMALDMWEHAYINDFGLDKEAYVEWFLSRLDWRNIRKRTKNFLRIK